MKIAQTCHSLVEFSTNHSDKFVAWKNGSNYLCCLECRWDQLDLLMTKLDIHRISYSKFYEPDMNNRLTSITVECLNDKLHKYFFKKLKLANHGK